MEFQLLVKLVKLSDLVEYQVQSYIFFCKCANFGVSLQHIRVENKKYGNYTYVDTVTKKNKNYLLKNNLNNFRANQLPGATGKTIHSVNWYINPKKFNFAVVNRIGSASNG